MPNIGDRVHVRPLRGLQVQRGDSLFGQFLPAEGMECTWDDYLSARMGEGCIEVVPPVVEEVPAIPPVPPLPRRRTEEPT